MLPAGTTVAWSYGTPRPAQRVSRRGAVVMRQRTFHRRIAWTRTDAERLGLGILSEGAENHPRSRCYFQALQIAASLRSRILHLVLLVDYAPLLRVLARFRV